ncbi:nuclear transport factor 2 family protein [Streptomyces sp. NPDC091371]|uniref:nuclear transport factor 2 family protein n=1 Tax=Streptomyces sp. NPDC091371 TaxID=3155303 RepID=UPI00343E2CA1
MADNAAIVKGLYEAIAKGDFDTVLGALDEQVEWNEAEHGPYWPGKAFIGPQAVAEGVFARIPQDFNVFRIEVQRIVGLGDTVLAEVRYHGTAKATSRNFNAQAAHVWDFRAGKCVRWQQYVDTWQIAHVTDFTPPAS